jgi:hypothetical protein
MFKVSHQRLLEIIPGAMTWGTLLLSIVLSFFIPEVVAIFLILYTALWFFRSLEFSYFLIKTYFINRLYLRIDWTRALAYINNVALIDEDIGHTTHKAFQKWLRSIKQAVLDMQASSECKPVEDIVHLIVIATYKEDIAILRHTLENIRASQYDTKKIYIVLAGEMRDEQRARRNGELLQQEYKHVFGDFYVTLHPDHIPGEVKGKGSNITYAAKTIVPVFLQQHQRDPSNVLVTTLDADNCVHPAYLANLTFHYLITPQRKYKSYQPLPLFYNNIWDVPMFNRVVAFGSSFWHMIESGRPDRLRNFSSHAQSLDALLETDFWSNTTIVEDGHQYWRSYFRFHGNYAVVPLFIPIYQDAVQHETYTKTLWSQYKQLRRWAWGCSDIPFVIKNMHQERKTIPFWNRFVNLYRLIEGHYMWATAAVIITLTVPVPRMINEQFAKTIMSYNMGITLSNFFLIAMVGIFVSIWVSLLMAPALPKENKKKYWWLRVTSIIQWFFLPITTVIFGSLPAIDAQTRLMIGKSLDFQVTEKIRTFPSNT